MITNVYQNKLLIRITLYVKEVFNLSLQPVRIRINDESFLRSEILGKKYVYDVMEGLYYRISEIEQLPLELKKKFEIKEDWQAIVENIIFLLRKIGAVHGQGNLTFVGKTWFNLLEELNMLLPVNPIEVLKEDIPGYFFRNCFLPNASITDRLVIISPWVSPLNGRKWLFKQTCKKIKETNVRTLVITRAPIEDWHIEALELLAESGADVYTNEDVHAKVMACKTKDKRKSVAIVGSANLTRSGRFDNVEAGVLIRGTTDRYYSLIEDLISSSYDLKKVKWVRK